MVVGSKALLQLLMNLSLPLLPTPPPSASSPLKRIWWMVGTAVKNVHDVESNSGQNVLAENLEGKTIDDPE